MVVKDNKDNVTNDSDTENIEKDLENKRSFLDKFGVLIYIILIIVFCVVIVLIVPRIVLNGDIDVFLSYDEEYKESGYSAYVMEKDISNKVIVSNNIIDGVVGNYEINYYLDVIGLRFRKVRNVSIVDKVRPIIELSDSNINVCPHEEVNISYRAFDEYDGDLSSKVEEVRTDNEILLRVYDSSDNCAVAIVKVNREDKEVPVIKLNGSSSLFLEYGKSYKEPGYSAVDNCDGDLTKEVKVSGSVGRNIGTYKLTYSVTDSSGNISSVTRKIIVGVKVNDNGKVNKGTVYLTFDDGPNNGTTNKILDILRDEGVKATFFVTNKGSDSLIKRMYDEGHTVGLHTDSHDYKYVYSSVDNYFKDLNRVSDRVKRITGVDSKIIRFPGGSSNTISRNYNKGIMSELTKIVLSEGYRYFDWNVDCKDASSSRNSNDVFYNVTANLSKDKANVVLMHDTKNITVEALRDIIKFGKEYGYEFSKIDMNTYMVRHNVNN